jgi:hypothetical protein
MTKSKGIGRGGARPGSGRKRKAITPRVQALKDALVALWGGASNSCEADRRFVRAMIALGAPNNATAGAFGISEAALLAKFPDELGPGTKDLWPAEAGKYTIASRNVEYSAPQQAHARGRHDEHPVPDSISPRREVGTFGTRGSSARVGRTS